MNTAITALFTLLLLVSTHALAEPTRTKVGVVVTLTGPFAQYGAKAQRAIETAAQQYPMDLVFEDEGCDPAMAIRSYKKLSAVDGVKVFLGPWCGSPQRVVAPLLKEGEQVGILSSAAPEEVYKISQGRMFSVQHSIEAESQENARFVAGLGLKTVVILFAESDFGRAHEKAFRAAYSGQVLETLTFPLGASSDIRMLVTKIRVLKPDAVYVPDAYPLMANLNRELHGAGLGSLPVFSVNSAESEDVMMAMGKYGEGVRYSYPEINGVEAIKHFAALATKILGEAILNCPPENAACVREQLLKNGKFDSNGVLQTKIIHKIVRNGQFVVED